MAGLFRCPECGDRHSRVVDSRENPTAKRQGFIYRRRMCGNGHKFTTYEVLGDDIDKLLKFREFWEALAKGASEALTNDH